MTPLDAVLERLLVMLDPVSPMVTSLEDAENAVLASPLAAEGAVPGAAVARRAGWAVRAAETAGATSYGPAPLSVRPVTVAPGDILPDGADAVLARDAVEFGTGAEALDAVLPGTGVRLSGDDIAAGAILRAAGSRLRILDLVAARAAGIGSCVVRRPRLLLVQAAAGPAAEAALSLLDRLGHGRGAWMEASPDGLSLLDEADLVVAVAPEPAALIVEAGFEALASGIAMAPGDETAVAFIDRVPLIAVADRPDAALAAFCLLVGPVLDRLAGAEPPAGWAAPLVRKIASTIGMAELSLLRLTERGYEPVGTGDLPLSALAEADHWLAVAADSEGHAAGDRVAAVPL